MKKVLKKEVIIVFIVGVIIASGITVYATSYFAQDISYTDKKSVASALDELYSLKTQSVQDLIDTSIQSNSACVNITTPDSSKDNWIKVADYPDGYNYNNCMIVSGYIQRSDDKLLIPTSYTDYRVMLRLSTSGIEMFYNGTLSNSANCPGKIMLQKIN